MLADCVRSEVQFSLDSLQEAFEVACDEIFRDKGRVDAGDGDPTGENAQEAGPNCRAVQKLSKSERRQGLLD